MSWALRNTLWASAFVIIPFIYITLRLYFSAKLLYPQHAGKAKYLVWVPVAWVNIFPLLMLFYYFKGTLLDELVYKSSTSAMDYFFLFPFWIGLIIIVEVLPYFLAAELLQPILNIFFSRIKEQIRRVLAMLRIGLLVLFIIFVTVTTMTNTYSVSESSFRIQIDDMPAEFDNLSLTLIADLQLDRFTQDNKMDEVRELINKDKPDLLFFAGDLVTRGKDFIGQGLEVMCDLQAVTERVACMGDHDYWAEPVQIASGLHDCGWSFLANAHQIIDYKGKKILVTGITYIYSQRTTPAQLQELMEKAPAADLKILRVHQPSKPVLKYAEMYKYDIFLAGHTHGGQVVFNPFGFELTPTRFENQYYSGFYKKNNMNIFVTNGVGLTMMPLRYGAPAEVINILLKNK